MKPIGIGTQEHSKALLAGWISRKELAGELDLAVDTLARWEARRVGPPCVRAGRKVLYRRSAVQDWLQAQEMPRAKKAGGRR
ncbi:transcriptional regulator [Rhodobacterales bacterium 52_120_T64]|nr:transcriptional regulator [Rhodobacterales bacterium 52_120_T64]